MSKIFGQINKTTTVYYRVSPKIKTSSNLDLGLEIDNSDIN